MATQAPDHDDQLCGLSWSASCDRCRVTIEEREVIIRLPAAAETRNLLAGLLRDMAYALDGRRSA
jgi:hypothetical protein